MRLRVAPAERFALIGVVAVLLLQAADAGAALEYQRTLLAAEPWRVLTAHLVHANWRHAALNALAWVALARLYAPELPPARQAAVLAASGLGVSLLLWLAAPQIDWYRGLSGCLHGLSAAGAVLWLARHLTDRAAADLHNRLLPALLLAVVWVKVLIEHRGGVPIWTQNWIGVAVVTQSHLFGAGVGTLVGVLLSLLRPEPIES